MRKFGTWWLVVGALMMVGAFFFNVSMPSPEAAEYYPQGVANLDLMNLRLMILLGGGFIFLAGAVFRAAGSIEDLIKSGRPSEPVRSALDDGAF